MGKTRKGLKYEVQDAFFKKAKKEGFVARSAFKLEELDKKYKLFRPGMKVLDLGCAPGSWLQYAAKQVGSSGKLWGIDLDPVRVNLGNVHTEQGDIFGVHPTDSRLSDYTPFDLIQSDAMTKTTGIPESDCARSIALVEHAVKLAQGGLLKNGGTLVAKVFEGPDFTPFYVNFKRIFQGCSVNHLKSTRQGSREVYVVGKSFKAPQKAATPPSEV